MEIPIRALRLNSNNDWVKSKERIGLIFFFSAYGFHLWHHSLFLLSCNFHKTKHKSIKSSRNREAKSFINYKVLQQFVKIHSLFHPRILLKALFVSQHTKPKTIESKRNFCWTFFFLHANISHLIWSVNSILCLLQKSLIRLIIQFNALNWDIYLKFCCSKLVLTSRYFFISRLLSASVKIQLVSVREAKLNFFLISCFKAISIPPQNSWMK